MDALDACCGLCDQKRLRLSLEVDECKPLPPTTNVFSPKYSRLKVMSELMMTSMHISSELPRSSGAS